jgi:hypothetical protein
MRPGVGGVVADTEGDRPVSPRDGRRSLDGPLEHGEIVRVDEPEEQRAERLADAVAEQPHAGRVRVGDDPRAVVDEDQVDRVLDQRGQPGLRLLRRVAGVGEVADVGDVGDDAVARRQPHRGDPDPDH